MGVVATLMLHGGVDILVVNAVGVSGAMTVCKFMNNNVGAGGTKGGLV